MLFPFQCKGFWPVGTSKRMQMEVKVTEKNLQTLPFYFTEAHSTLLALPAEVGEDKCITVTRNTTEIHKF